MAMERALLRLIMRATRAQTCGAMVQRGATSVSPMREYMASTVLFDKVGFFHSELRAYSGSSVEKTDAPQADVELPEFGNRKPPAAKRYAVGRTAIADDEVQGERQTDKETKEKAREFLQQVGMKLGETVEETKVRQLQEKLAATEGIGDVVHELYNQQEDHTEHSQPGDGVKA